MQSIKIFNEFHQVSTESSQHSVISRHLTKAEKVFSKQLQNHLGGDIQKKNETELTFRQQFIFLFNCVQVIVRPVRPVEWRSDSHLSLSTYSLGHIVRTGQDINHHDAQWTIPSVGTQLALSQTLDQCLQVPKDIVTKQL